MKRFALGVVAGAAAVIAAAWLDAWSRGEWGRWDDS